MKNLKVSVKLIVGFLLVAALTAIVGIMGIVGMRSIDNSFDNMYNNQTVPLPSMSTAIEMLQRQRACMREYIVGAALNDSSLIEDAHGRVLDYQPQLEAALDDYEKTINTSTEAGKKAKDLFDEARNLYNTSFMECLDKIYNGAHDGVGDEGFDAGTLYTLMKDYTDDVNKVTDNFGQCMQLKIDSAKDAYTTSTASADRSLMITVIILVVAVVIAIILALYISSIISKPLAQLTGFMKKASSTGDLRFSKEEEDTIRDYAQNRDEIGQCINATAGFIKRITDIGNELEVISNGDLTSSVSLLSDRDIMGVSLQKMNAKLNDMFGEINSSSSQVNMGSKQIADGAQALASGSTEQAATIEELSSSTAEISGKTKQNAEMATKAAELADVIIKSAEKGSRQMDEMMAAVNDINQASQNISKVIKVIDDIAFQTNILALNAAVEAARAGQHGKGFAVVAEEVRNLAGKSAEAAKDTSELISNSIEKAELGARIANETASSLTEIVSGINESSQLVNEIARSSEEQSMGISQINTGIEQVTQVIQQNSATAEQSAAAAQEMSGQSEMLEELIRQFRLKS
ncbi:MAG: methyl-accepting chemotaxis protein [Oscillospiraceae bacterium]|jgi:methyl-accepting chemotaxis protein|nr:methyl-accepting chemotaxis protein [Oscillospiraceae bacterium]